jgi:hypothetical protein
LQHFNGVVWSTPLGRPEDVAYACTNIQQVVEEEEETPHIDTWHNARVWADFLGGLH